MVTRHSMFALVSIVLFSALFATACGDDSESLQSHVLTCKVAGYYVLLTTPEAERQQLRVGLFGLIDGTSQWVEVSSSAIAPYVDDPSVQVADITMSEEPDDRIVMRTETNGAEYYLLELHSYLDLNANGSWDAGEPFVDGKNLTDYTATSSSSWVYFFKETTSKAEYGYNYKLGTSYNSNFEDLNPVEMGAIFLIDSYKTGDK